MRSSILFVILFIAVFFNLSFAEEVDITVVKKIIEAKVNDFNKRSTVYYSTESDPQIFHFSGEKFAFVQALNPKGFLVLSTDNELEPILGYSLTHNFNWDTHPENLMYNLLVMDVKLRKQLLKYKSINEKQIQKDKWESLAERGFKSVIDAQTIWPEPGTTSTEGWLETLWHQRDPFNASCPYDNINDGRSAVGCVATAMAMIINYHGFPNNFPDFDDSYDYESSYNGFTFFIDDDCGTNGTPNWNQLNSSLNTINYPLTVESDNLDEFCFATGTSVQMQYSNSGSGAFTSKVANAFTNTFDYSNAEWKVLSETDFFSILKTNMKSGQPAEMEIRKEEGGGHAIVTDGFDEQGTGSDDDLYHLNYGWGSQSRCYWWNLLGSELPAGYDYISGAVLNISPGDFFLVENLGEANLTINSVDVDKTWLEVSLPQALPIELTPGEKFKLYISINDWTNISLPDETATVTIHSDDPDEEYTYTTVTAVPITPTYEITVTSPNGGENWEVGNNHSITWDYSNPTGNVKIELTRNNGSSWETLEPNWPGSDGYCSWPSLCKL